MFYNHHFIGLHWIWWIFIIAIIVLLVYNVIQFRPKRDSTEEAMDILRKRFARGEIEREEFEERKEILEKHK